MLLCYYRFLFGDVSAYFEDFHAVEERSGDDVEVVGGADEEEEVYGDVHATNKLVDFSVGFSRGRGGLTSDPKNPLFCSGSNIYIRAQAESPLIPRSILSTSSINTTGYSVPTRLNAWIIFRPIVGLSTSRKMKKEEWGGGRKRENTDPI
jgi:hypothetical protein